MVVTGASRGIGAAIAERLAQRGCQLVLADIDVVEGSALAERLRHAGHDVRFHDVDISMPASARALMEAAASQMDGIDGLVNNAGLDAPPGHALDLDDEDWQRVIDVNLSGVWWCTQAVLPHMVAGNGGKIVNISSIAARQGSDRYSPAYAAAKAGVLGLTVGVARQVESRRILVNAVMPGATGNTGTPLLLAERDELARTFPLGFGGTTPVVDAVCYLLDSSGDWMSGSVVNVSGGQLRGI